MLIAVLVHISPIRAPVLACCALQDLLPILGQLSALFVVRVNMQVRQIVLLVQLGNIQVRPPLVAPHVPPDNLPRPREAQDHVSIANLVYILLEEAHVLVVSLLLTIQALERPVAHSAPPGNPPLLGLLCAATAQRESLPPKKDHHVKIVRLDNILLSEVQLHVYFARQASLLLLGILIVPRAHLAHLARMRAHFVWDAQRERTVRH